MDGQHAPLYAFAHAIKFAGWGQFVSAERHGRGNDRMAQERRRPDAGDIRALAYTVDEHGRLGGGAGTGAREDRGFDVLAAYKRHIKRHQAHLWGGAKMAMHLVVGVSPEWFEVHGKGDPHDPDNPNVRKLIKTATEWAQSELGGVFAVRYDVDETGSSVVDVLVAPLFRGGRAKKPKLWVSVNKALKRMARRSNRSEKDTYSAMQDSWALWADSHLEGNLVRGRPASETGIRHKSPEEYKALLADQQAVAVEREAAREDLAEAKEERDAAGVSRRWAQRHQQAAASSEERTRRALDELADLEEEVRAASAAAATLKVEAETTQAAADADRDTAATMMAEAATMRAEAAAERDAATALGDKAREAWSAAQDMSRDAERDKAKVEAARAKARDEQRRAEDATARWQEAGREAERQRADAEAEIETLRRDRERTEATTKRQEAVLEATRQEADRLGKLRRKVRRLYTAFLRLWTLRRRRLTSAIGERERVVAQQVSAALTIEARQSVQGTVDGERWDAVDGGRPVPVMESWKASEAYQAGATDDAAYTAHVGRLALESLRGVQDESRRVLVRLAREEGKRLGVYAGRERGRRRRGLDEPSVKERARGVLPVSKDARLPGVERPRGNDRPGGPDL